jgi:hypothetical protein
VADGEELNVDDEQYFIDQEIGKSTLECIDEGWDGAELVVDMSVLGKVGVVLRRLGSADVAVPSAALDLAIGHLVQHHTDTQSGLQRISYRFTRKPDGKWKFEADFVYPED